MSEDIYEQLSQPFPMEVIELKPGATNKDKTKALAMPYADKRVYEDRLDAVLGAGNWMVGYEPWGNDRVFCHLTINGITKTDVGESDQKNNGATIAVAQAFKRACSCFGLGRYLYSLPTKWLAYDGYGFTGDVAGTIRAMYREASIGMPASTVNREALSAEIISIYTKLGYTQAQLDKMSAKIPGMSDRELLNAAADAKAKADEQRSELRRVS